MYIATLLLSFVVLPGIFILIHALAYGDTLPFVLIVGKWMVLFAVGIRLLAIGVRQVLRPRASAKREFGVTDEHAPRIMQTLGLINAALGVFGIATIFNSAWIVPASLAGALYYAFLAVQDFLTKAKNLYGYFAIGSNAFAALVLAAVVLTSFL